MKGQATGSPNDPGRSTETNGHSPFQKAAKPSEPESINECEEIEEGEIIEIIDLPPPDIKYTDIEGSARDSITLNPPHLRYVDLEISEDFSKSKIPLKTEQYCSNCGFCFGQVSSSSAQVVSESGLPPPTILYDCFEDDAEPAEPSKEKRDTFEGEISDQSSVLNSERSSDMSDVRKRGENEYRPSVAQGLDSISAPLAIKNVYRPSFFNRNSNALVLLQSSERQGSFQGPNSLQPIDERSHLVDDGPRKEKRLSLLFDEVEKLPSPSFDTSSSKSKLALDFQRPKKRYVPLRVSKNSNFLTGTGNVSELIREFRTEGDLPPPAIHYELTPNTPKQDDLSTSWPLDYSNISDPTCKHENISTRTIAEKNLIPPPPLTYTELGQSADLAVLSKACFETAQYVLVSKPLPPPPITYVSGGTAIFFGPSQMFRKKKGAIKYKQGDVLLIDQMFQTNRHLVDSIATRKERIEEEEEVLPVFSEAELQESRSGSSGSSISQDSLTKLNSKVTVKFNPEQRADVPYFAKVEEEASTGEEASKQLQEDAAGPEFTSLQNRKTRISEVVVFPKVRISVANLLPAAESPEVYEELAKEIKDSELFPEIVYEEPLDFSDEEIEPSDFKTEDFQTGELASPRTLGKLSADEVHPLPAKLTAIKEAPRLSVKCRDSIKVAGLEGNPPGQPADAPRVSKFSTFQPRKTIKVAGIDRGLIDRVSDAPRPSDFASVKCRNTIKVSGIDSASFNQPIIGQNAKVQEIDQSYPSVESNAYLRASASPPKSTLPYPEYIPETPRTSAADLINIDPLEESLLMETSAADYLRQIVSSAAPEASDSSKSNQGGSKALVPGAGTKEPSFDQSPPQNFEKKNQTPVPQDAGPGFEASSSAQLLLSQIPSDQAKAQKIQRMEIPPGLAHSAPVPFVMEAKPRTSRGAIKPSKLPAINPESHELGYKIQMMREMNKAFSQSSIAELEKASQKLVSKDFIEYLGSLTPESLYFVEKVQQLIRQRTDRKIMLKIQKQEQKTELYKSQLSASRLSGQKDRKEFGI